MADMENHWLDSPSYLEQSYLGLSVLDVFCVGDLRIVRNVSLTRFLFSGLPELRFDGCGPLDVSHENHSWGLCSGRIIVQAIRPRFDDSIPFVVPASLL